MNSEIYFKDIFESIPDYRKIHLMQNDKNLLREIGSSERDISRSKLDFKKILIEHQEKYLDYVKNEEESILERILNKKMEPYYSKLFDDIRHERSLIYLLSLTDPDILRQSKFTDDEIEIIKNLVLEKLHRQRILKEHVAKDLLKKINNIV